MTVSSERLHVDYWKQVGQKPQSVPGITVDTEKTMEGGQYLLGIV